MRVDAKSVVGIGVMALVGFLSSLFGGMSSAQADWCSCTVMSSCWQSLPSAPQDCASYNGSAYNEVDHNGEIVGSGTLSGCGLTSSFSSDPGYPSRCDLS